jgi:NadR type nicotinamide-nucleotide adenylyltransferase
MLKKIVIIGPESTGKTTLCRQLAEYFKTEWVPEYARAYLETNGTKYNYEDLDKIAEGQIRGEELATEKMLNKKDPATFDRSDLLFIDTDLYVIKVWSEFVFNNCNNRVLKGIVNRQYNGYLLCNIDLPWIKDALREYPDPGPREKLYHYYKDAMINQDTPWVEISGSYEERLQKAIDAVTQLLTRN